MLLNLLHESHIQNIVLAVPFVYSSQMVVVFLLDPFHNALIRDAERNSYDDQIKISSFE